MDIIKSIQTINKIRDTVKRRTLKAAEKEKKKTETVKWVQKSKSRWGGLILDNPMTRLKRQAVFVDKSHDSKKETLITVLEEDKSLRDKDIMRNKKATAAIGKIVLHDQ